MRQSMKSGATLIVLISFLFPLVVQSIHSWEHKEAIHCKSGGSKHAHVVTHYCPICDFMLPAYEVPGGLQLADYGSPPITTAIFSFFEVIPISNQLHSFSLRAPPVNVGLCRKSFPKDDRKIMFGLKA